MGAVCPKELHAAGECFEGLWYSLYLLYLYKSANTDAEAGECFEGLWSHFTCCPRTKVQILTPEALRRQESRRARKELCLLAVLVQDYKS